MCKSPVCGAVSEKEGHTVTDRVAVGRSTRHASHTVDARVHHITEDGPQPDCPLVRPRASHLLLTACVMHDGCLLKAYLHVITYNDAAIRFYESNRFVRLRTLPGQCQSNPMHPAS